MPGEALVQYKILAYLKERGAYAVKIHGNNYQPKTIDIVACYRGVFIGIEVKASPMLKATPRQRATLEEIRDANGVSLVAYEVSQIQLTLDMIDDGLDFSRSLANLGRTLRRLSVKVANASTID